MSIQLMFGYGFIALSLLVMACTAIAAVTSIWCRERSENGLLLLHEAPEYMTRIERVHVWFRHRGAELILLFVALGLFYFIVIPELNIWHYLVAFVVVPIVFRQSVRQTQMVLRRKELEASIAQIELASWLAKQPKRRRRMW